MPEYIEREAVVEMLRRQYTGTWRGIPHYTDEIRTALREVKEMPAADVVSRATIEQVMWERDTAMEQLKEHGIPFGGKADVVAVVRCKECKHHQREQDPCHGRTEHYCKKLKAEVYKDFFCAYGERRGEDEV